MADSETRTSPSINNTPKTHCLPRFETKLQKSSTLYKSRCSELSVKIHASPRPLITWFHNDSIVNENERIRFEQTDDGWCKLCFRNVRESDSGVFKIVVLNELGMNYSQTEVHVELGAPIISSLCKSNISLEKGKKLCIVVSVKGYGHEYDVIWLRNLQEITDGTERVRLTKKRHMCSLKIDSVEHDSIGIYMCIVSSNGGEASIKFNLDVKDEEINKENKEIASKKKNLTHCNRLEESFRTKDQRMPLARKETGTISNIHSITPPAYRKEISSPAKLSPCCRIKNFIKESLNIKPKNVEQHMQNRSKSFPDFSVFHFDEMMMRNNVKSYSPRATSVKTFKSVGVSASKLTSLKTRCSSSPSLLNESVRVKDPTSSRKEWPCPKVSRSPFSGITTHMKKLKPSMNRQFSPYRSPVQSKDKDTPPRLVKYGSNL